MSKDCAKQEAWVRLMEKLSDLSLSQKLFLIAMGYWYICAWVWIQVIAFRASMITFYFSEIFPHAFWEFI